MLGVQNGATVPPDCAPSSPSHWQWMLPLIHAQMGNGPVTICECGMEDQIADHIIKRCQYSSPNGIHADLDDDTIK